MPALMPVRLVDSSYGVLASFLILTVNPSCPADKGTNWGIFFIIKPDRHLRLRPNPLILPHLAVEYFIHGTEMLVYADWVGYILIQSWYS